VSYASCHSGKGDCVPWVPESSPPHQDWKRFPVYLQLALVCSIAFSRAATVCTVGVRERLNANVTRKPFTYVLGSEIYYALATRRDGKRIQHLAKVLQHFQQTIISQPVAAFLAASEFSAMQAAEQGGNSITQV